MNRLLCVICFVVLIAMTYAQLGSVHCKVGCACSDELKPLCGNDRKTYQNECKLRCAQCDKEGLQALFPGRCEDVVFSLPGPVVSYNAPLPFYQFGVVPPYYPYLPRPNY